MDTCSTPTAASTRYSDPTQPGSPSTATRGSCARWTPHEPEEAKERRRRFLLHQVKETLAARVERRHERRRNTASAISHRPHPSDRQREVRKAATAEGKGSARCEHH